MCMAPDKLLNSLNFGSFVHNMKASQCLPKRVTFRFKCNNWLEILYKSEILSVDG